MICVSSGFHLDTEDICIILGYYAAYSSNSVPTFRGNLTVPSSRVKKSKNNELLDPRRRDKMLSRNFVKELPLISA